MLRVTVEVVPWGQEGFAEEIARLHIGNVSPEDEPYPHHHGDYSVCVIEDGREVEIGRFRLHRFGWQRNRLGLAARALKMLQLRRDRGHHVPTLSALLEHGEAYVRDANGNGSRLPSRR